MLQITHPSHKFKQQAYAGTPPPPASGRNADDVRSEFQLLYERAPLRAIRMFLHYLSARGLDPIAHQMAFWATSGTTYISVLLDADPLGQDSLRPETAADAVAVLPAVDPQFLIKLARCVAELTEAPAILQALRLVPALRDYSILIPWLRVLEGHSDSRVRSRVAKLLCFLRPNIGLIQRHMQSRDARVRASVMEALWSPKTSQIDHTALMILRLGVSDENHRVAANALVGLYRLGESAALEKMIVLCTKKQQLLRAAMAWAMSVIDDSRAIPSLQRLLHDPSFMVRKHATTGLLALGVELEEERAVHPHLQLL